MKSIKLNRFPCDQCGFKEDVPEDQKAKIIAVTVSGNAYQICPDCLFKTEIWRKHVNEDDLRNEWNESEKEGETTEQFNDRINDEMAKSQARLKELTRPKMEVLQD